MSTAADIAYWNQGIENVPAQTGAAMLMDCSDLIAVFDKLGEPVPLQGRVLDVGCGTGRLAKLCAHGYIGCDVAIDAVNYTLRQGRFAVPISGPFDLAGASPFWQFHLVCAFSVFTHVGRQERQDYLEAFRACAAEAFVDIIPGNGLGDVELWSAVATEFERDAQLAGWAVLATYERVCPSGPLHRYYRLTRCA